MTTSKINWLLDDGVNLPMINDVPRNVFYDKILSKTVGNKKCCDVGFSTGLLSLLALKHGAVSIIAFEANANRFELGQQIIEHLKLADRIELRNCRATNNDIEQTGCDIVFHEIIHQGLWGEGLWYIKPSKVGIEYVPGNYFFEMYITEISDSTVDGFVNGDHSKDYFNPGIKIDREFIDLINNFIVNDDSRNIQVVDRQDQLQKLNWNNIHKDWSWNPGTVFRSYPKQLACKYEVDYNKRKSTFIDSNGIREIDLDSCNSCEMIIDTKSWQDTNIMLEFRFGLQHGQDRLYLDDCRGWGSEVPWIYSKPKKDLLFVQDFQGNFYNGMPFSLTKKVQ